MNTEYLCILCLEKLSSTEKHCDREPIELALYLADIPGWTAQREHELKQKQKQSVNKE